MENCKVIFNVTGKPINTTETTENKEKMIKKLLIQQLTMPVKWYQSIIFCYENHFTFFSEFGPKTTLTDLIQDIGTHSYQNYNLRSNLKFAR